MEHNHMAVVGLRLLVQLLAMLYAVLAGLTLYAFGLKREAFKAVAIGALVAWAVSPDKAARCSYYEFQRQRLGHPDQ